MSQPSGDDTLTEILDELVKPGVCNWMQRERSHKAGLTDDCDTRIAEARTQLLQYVEGIIGEDEVFTGNETDIRHLIKVELDNLRAEQRQQLRRDERLAKWGRPE